MLRETALLRNVLLRRNWVKSAVEAFLEINMKMNLHVKQEEIRELVEHK